MRTLLIQSHIPLDLTHPTRRPVPDLGSGASIRFIAGEECAGASFTAKLAFNRRYLSHISLLQLGETCAISSHSIFIPHWSHPTRIVASTPVNFGVTDPHASEHANALLDGADPGVSMLLKTYLTACLVEILIVVVVRANSSNTS
jgi:hypothetical protein